MHRLLSRSLTCRDCPFDGIRDLAGGIDGIAEPARRRAARSSQIPEDALIRGSLSIVAIRAVFWRRDT